MLKTITIDAREIDGVLKFVVTLSTPDHQTPLELDYHYFNDAVTTAKVFAREHEAGYSITYDALEAERNKNR